MSKRVYESDNITTKKLRVDDPIINNNNNDNNSDNNERLFRLVWNNKFIRNKILYYLKSTWRSILLPKYINSNDINIGYQHVKYYKKINGFGYDQINKVSKMLKYDQTWLLKLKVSRGDSLDFRLSKRQKNNNKLQIQIQIFSKIKDDIQFYKDLFKNYSKYYNINKSWDETFYSIIKCDCWAGLQVLVEDLKLVEVGINYYILAICSGSINCAKYLLNKFNFKLNKSQIIKILKVILEVDQVQDQKEQVENKTESYDSSCIIGISESQQIKEFGFKFNGDNLDEYKQVKKNQTILFLKSRIEQEEKEEEFKLDLNELVTSVVNYEIHDKPLKFLIESCYAISFILKFIAIPFSSFQFSNNVIENVHKNPWKLVLSNEQLKEIERFTNDELNQTLVDFELSNQKINTIKQLAEMIISFGGGCSKFNIDFYNAKFKNQFSEQDHWIVSAGFGIYCKFDDKRKYDITDYLFKFCKNGTFAKNKFIKDLVQDIVYQGGPRSKYKLTKISYHNYANGVFADGIKEYQVKEMFIFKSILEFLLVKDGNIELLSLFINEMVEKSKDKGVSFFTSFSTVFGCIQSTAVFDLFYTNQHTKNYINIIDFINYYSKRIKQLESINQLISYQKSSSLLSVLNHIKSNYNQDYIKFCNEFKMQDSYYSNEFFYTYDFFNDFKDKLELELYWNKVEKYKEYRENSNNSPYLYRNVVCLEPPKDLSVYQFIKILESTPLDQKYNYLNNIEIMAWVIEFRNQDLETGRCDPIDKKTLFKYYYLSNQLEKGIDTIDVILIQDQFELFIKPIIKFNYLDDLNLVYQFISSIQSLSSNNKYISSIITQINQDLLIYSTKYNNLNAIKFLYEIDKDHKLLFNQTNLDNSYGTIYLNGLIKSIEVFDYLYNNNNK